MSKNILIIAGMHRSGTSLVTQWLYKCGLTIGDDLMAGNTGNVQGYFEDNDFVHLHERLLLQHGLPDTGLTDRPLPVLSENSLSTISGLLDRKSLYHDQWAWKDPRTCLFLPVYRQLAGEARYLVIYRDYRACIHSLIQRQLKDEKRRYCSSGKKFAAQRWNWYKMKKVSKALHTEHAEQYLKVWIRYNQEILAHIGSLPSDRYLVLDYHALLNDDKPAFHHLSEAWKFRLNYSPFRAVYSSNLMSKTAQIDEYIQDSSLFQLADRLSDQLKSFEA